MGPSLRSGRQERVSFVVLRHTGHPEGLCHPERACHPERSEGSINHVDPSGARYARPSGWQKQLSCHPERPCHPEGLCHPERSEGSI